MMSVNGTYYDAITVKSPMDDGVERKDQDRAAWFPIRQTACVCDGVTSSPFSAEAADLVCEFSQILFPNHTKRRLHALCDLLLVRRNEKLHSEISLPPDMPHGMRDIMRDAVQQNMSHSFQTTMVAANFVAGQPAVLASVLRCGDSIFLAFGSDGELLAASLSDNERPGSRMMQLPKDRFSVSPYTYRRIDFGPGDEILAKVICNTSKYPHLAARAGVGAEYMENWFICVVLDRCAGGSCKKNATKGHVLYLKCGDLLIVPRYLAGLAIQIECRSYIRIPYSHRVRPIHSPPENVNLQRPGAITAVLPDHFYTGGWVHFQERFPRDAHFVLSTDGFYNCFRQPADLWSWLNKHREDLSQSAKQGMILERLHIDLRQRRGDDDISFVWVYPKQANKSSPEMTK